MWGCGIKVAKGWVIDKETQIPVECKRHMSGEIDCETTLYCQCFCASLECCPVKILVEYIAALKDPKFMSHKFNGDDCSWMGDPNSKTKKKQKAIPYNNLPFFREVKVCEWLSGVTSRWLKVEPEGIGSCTDFCFVTERTR